MADRRPIASAPAKTTDSTWVGFIFSFLLFIFPSWPSFLSVTVEVCRDSPEVVPEDSRWAFQLLSKCRIKRNRYSQILHKHSSNKQAWSSSAKNAIKVYLIYATEQSWQGSLSDTERQQGKAVLSKQKAQNKNKCLCEEILKIHFLYGLPVPHVPGKLKAIYSVCVYEHTEAFYGASSRLGEQSESCSQHQ